MIKARKYPIDSKQDEQDGEYFKDMNPVVSQQSNPSITMSMQNIVSTCERYFTC